MRGTSVAPNPAIQDACKSDGFHRGGVADNVFKDTIEKLQLAEAHATESKLEDIFTYISPSPGLYYSLGLASFVKDIAHTF